MSVGYFVTFQTIHYSELQSHIIGLFVITACHGSFLSPHFAPIEDVPMKIQ